MTPLNCFVIMPFEDELDNLYTKIIKPTLESRGISVTRGDDVSSKQSILKDIVQGISNCDFVVADLTDLNPNVFYELGLAHGLNKPCYLLTQSVESLPFDLRSYRVLPYGLRFYETDELTAELSKWIDDIRQRSVIFGSPVSDFLDGVSSPTIRRSFDDLGQESTSGADGDQKVAPPDAEDAPDLSSEDGVYDLLGEAEDAVKQIGSIMSEMNLSVNEMSSSLDKKSARLVQLRSEGQPSTMMIRGELQSIANAIQAPIDVIKPKLPGLRQAWDDYFRKTSGLIEVARTLPSIESDVFEELLESTESFRASTSGAREALKSAGESSAAVSGLSRDLTKAAKSFAQVFDELGEILALGESYAARIIALIKSERESTGE